MSQEEVEALLKKAVQSLFDHQPDIYDFTPETGQTEWNLSHHFANEVKELLKGLDHDLDVMKLNLDNKRPDIIFHKRGNHDSNFLVIEVKRDGGNSKLEDDANKIREYWFGRRLRYRFGAVVNLKPDKTGEVRLFENPEAFESSNSKDHA
jgi:hypothetical protein